MNKKNIIFILLLFLAAILIFFSEEPFNKDLLQLNFFNSFIFSFLVIINQSLLFPKGVVDFKTQINEFTGVLKWKNKYIKYTMMLTPICLSLPFLFKKNLIEFTIVFSLLFLQNIITFLLLSRFDLKKNKTIISNFFIFLLVLFLIADRYDVLILKYVVYFIGSTTSYYFYLFSESEININVGIIFGFIITFVIIMILYFIDKFKVSKKKLDSNL